MLLKYYMYKIELYSRGCGDIDKSVRLACVVKQAVTAKLLNARQQVTESGCYGDDH